MTRLMFVSPSKTRKPRTHLVVDKLEVPADAERLAALLFTPLQAPEELLAVFSVELERETLHPLFVTAAHVNSYKTLASFVRKNF